VATHGFEATLDALAGVEGWMTNAQAHRLWKRAEALTPTAQVVEIGSYRGRSAILLGRAAPAGVSVTAVDPHAGNDRGPRQIEGTADEGDADNRAFQRNLARAGVAERVRHLRLSSQAALEAVEGPVHLLYVDGAHRYVPAREDIARWGQRVPHGGTLLIHDAFSSIGVTLVTLRLLVFGTRFRYHGRSGSLAEYRRAELSGVSRLINASRQLAQLPWFLRNLAVKAALIARVRPLARLLGHGTGDWPY
jgi:Methyltransferase domain